MRKYRTEKVEWEKKVLVSVTCDWCGGKVERDMDRFETREFTLEFMEGSAFPSGGNKEGWQVEDLCNSCAAKLRHLLFDQGIAVTVVEIDW